MANIQISFDITPQKAFEILLGSLCVKLNDKIKEEDFVIEDEEIKIKDYDDRGELIMALYHLATKMFPNTEVRSLFNDPNILMSELYNKKKEITLSDSKWIPVDKELPKEKGYYYVSDGKVVWICQFVRIIGVQGWINSVNDPVIKAWMPKPEPYKESEEIND